MAATGGTVNVNIGVLGHVDSGKTSLVRALSTHLSTASLDKHPESKRRGITLDLGFSSFVADAPEQFHESGVKTVQCTLVDCPGHASLMRTVIGGAQIIDMMILVVDVTKGIQAQTAECLILGEITTNTLVVALNKTDLLPGDQASSGLRRPSSPHVTGGALTHKQQLFTSSVLQASNMALSQHAIDTVKATAPAVAPHVQEITTLFYKKMLGRHPELYQFFNKSGQRTKRQPRALADAVVAYASNIENLGVLGPAVERMATKHCALQVKPEHYGIVHDNLMEAIAETLGDAVTEDVAAGWSEAVNALAGILINHEAGLYEAAAQREGGWSGWRKFAIAERTKHNDSVSTISFKAADGYDGGFDFTPGMYLTVDAGLKDAEGDIVAPRHYTITSAPGDKVLQITVKHLKDGKASGALHTLEEGAEVNLSPPFGEFKNDSGEKEAVLLSAGIGVTPMYALHKHGGLNVKYAMHVDHAADSNPFATHYVDTPNFEQVITSEAGRPEMDALVKQVAEGAGGLSHKDVYVCGPTGFMMEAVRTLKLAGAEKVLFENFGPRTNEARD